MHQQLTTFEHHKPAFPIHPKDPYNTSSLTHINQLVNQYHSSHWIRLEDQILLQDNHEYMKRIYTTEDYNNKIKILGDYYRFHFQAPRIFMQGFGRIIATNTEEKRALQYQIVTNQISKNKESITSRKSSISKFQPHQKLIKDVELSYGDFENKPDKLNQNRNKSKNNSCIKTDRTKQQIPYLAKRNGKQIIDLQQKGRKTLQRVASVSSKGSFVLFKPSAEVEREKVKKQLHQNKNIKPKENNYRKPTISTKIISSKKQTSAKTSKIVSVNNSVVSNKGMSRSKSRTHLDNYNSNNLKSKQLKTNTDHKAKKICSSNQNSVKKIQYTRKELSEKNIPQPLSRKGSKTELLKPLAANSSHKTITIYARNKKTQNQNNKEAQNHLDKNVKNMFNKAIEVRKRRN